MATARQVEANRKNAQSSTGPRTVKGKARVARNALKHGLSAKRVLLPNEDPDEYAAFANRLRDALDPVGDWEQFLVENIVTYAWRLRRVPVLEAALHALAKHEAMIADLRRQIEECDNASYEDFRLEGMDPNTREDYLQAKVKLQAAIKKGYEAPSLNMALVLERRERELGNLTRHEESLLRSMLKLLHELQRSQAERAGKDVAAPTAVDLNVNINRDDAFTPEGKPMSGRTLQGEIISGCDAEQQKSAYERK